MKRTTWIVGVTAGLFLSDRGHPWSKRPQAEGSRDREGVRREDDSTKPAQRRR